MKVIATPGLKVPTEADPRQYITDSQPVDVDVTAYYLRRMADNELVEVLDKPATKPADKPADKAA